MSKQIFVFIFIIGLLFTATEIQAFDGNRKGFVLSGGVELADISLSGNKSSFYPGNYNRFTFGFSLGYAFNEKNVLAYDRRLIFIKANGKYSFFQSVGLSWSHFFSKEKKSFFTKIGIKNNADAFLIGGGYMFTNNIQIGLAYHYVSKYNNADRIKLYLSYVAF